MDNNIVKIFIGVCYLDSQNMGFSSISETKDGDFLDTQHLTTETNSIENLVVKTIYRVTGKANKKNITHIAIYTSNNIVIRFIKRIIKNEDYDDVKPLKFQPRGRVFKNISDWGIKMMIFDKSENASFDLVKKNSVYILNETIKEKGLMKKEKRV